MGGLIDLPTTTDYMPWMNNSNPPDAIDYTRPREGFTMSTTPLDVNNLDLGGIWNRLKQYVGLGEEEPKEEKPQTSQPEEEETEELDEIEEKPEEKGVNLVAAFQDFFSKANPIIGAMYSGPKDGKINPQLIAAAQGTETKIASLIGNGGVQGLIWNGKSFNTSPADVAQALALIEQHKSKKASSEDRMAIFSSLIDD